MRVCERCGKRPAIQPGEGPREGGTRAWKVCCECLEQLVALWHQSWGK